MGMTNAQIMKTVLNGNSRQYATLIAGGLDPFTAVTTYQQGSNEFLQDLINKIGITTVRGFIFNNPLAKFKKGNLPLGDTLEDIYVGLVRPHEFNDSEDFDGRAEFGQEKPDIEVCYHKVNRKQYYKVSVSDERLKSAFMEEGGLQALVAEIIGTPVRSNDLDEFTYTKKLLSDNLGNTVTIPVKAESGETLAKALLKQIKKYSKRLKFANDGYNSLRSLQAVPFENQDLILPVDVATDIDMDVLASIYNLDKASIEAKITEVDNFEGADVLAWLVDNRALQIRDHIINSATNYVASKLMTNIFFHVHQMYGYSLYGTNIAFVDDSKCKTVSKDSAGNDFSLVVEKALPGSMVVVVPNPSKTVKTIEWKKDSGSYTTLASGVTTFAMPADTTTGVTVKVTYES